MNYHTVEGVDYIFDRYSFLNAILEGAGRPERLDQQSSIDDIDHALSKARAAYHPDRLNRVGSDLQKSAAITRDNLEQCAQILTDAAIRPLYDEKLAQFQRDTPNLISTSGTPILDLTRPRFDLDSLLAAEIPDTTSFENAVKDLAGYDDQQFNQVKTLFKAMPDNEQIRALYRNALTGRFIYLSLLEDAAWAKVGYQTHNRAVVDTPIGAADEYMAAVEKMLDHTNTQKIDIALTQRGGAAQLGLAKLPLLLGHNPAGANATDATTTALADPRLFQEVLEKLKKQAQDNFAIRADYVRQAARLKQEALVELVTLNPIITVAEHGDDPAYEIFLATPEPDSRVLLQLDFNVATRHAALAEFTPVAKTSFIQQAFHHHALIVEHNPEIRFSHALTELSAAADAILSAREQASAKAVITPIIP